jgi:hypothetical protein
MVDLGGILSPFPFGGLVRAIGCQREEDVKI